MRKNRVIKIVIILLLMLIILMQNIKIFAAPVVVTKENLQEAFNEFLKLQENSEEKMTIDVGNEIITFKMDGVNYESQYNLTGKPIFTTEVEIKNGTTFDEYEEMTGGLLILPMYNYAAVAKIQGEDYEEAAFYMLSKILNESTKNGEFVSIEDDFEEKTVEYVDRLYPYLIKITDSDGANTFELNIERKKVSETSRKIVSTLIVNIDGDYSKIKDSAIDIEGDISISKNIIISENIVVSTNNIITDTTNIISSESKVDEDVVGMANQLLKNNLKGSGSSSGNKYPNAGLETNIFVPIIKVLIGLLVISLVCMIIKVRKNKKD